MRLRVLDDDRHGYARLSFEGSPANAALNVLQLALSFRSQHRGAFLGPDGRWQKEAHFFAATRIGEEAGAILFQVGPEVVNHLNDLDSIEIATPDSSLALTTIWENAIPQLAARPSSKIHQPNDAVLIQEVKGPKQPGSEADVGDTQTQDNPPETAPDAPQQQVPDLSPPPPPPPPDPPPPILKTPAVETAPEPPPISPPAPEPAPTVPPAKKRVLARPGVLLGLGFAALLLAAGVWLVIGRTPGLLVAETPPKPACRAVPASSRPPAPLAASEECGLKPKDVFKECSNCPEMLVVPSGTFTMGSPTSETGRDDNEGPLHNVRIAQAFAIGKFPVTRAEFAAFVAETNYDAGTRCAAWNGKSWEERAGLSWRNPGFPQTDAHAVTCVNWSDMQAYLAWLRGKTGGDYRLLSEAEWEYAARAQTVPGIYPRYFFGDDEKSLCTYANGADQTTRQKVPSTRSWSFLGCSDGYAYTSPVGRFEPNGFGLYDMLGNVWQWTQDCWHDTYAGAPSDGTAWTSGDCSRRAARGGAWNSYDLRAAARASDTFAHKDSSGRDDNSGFRVARTLHF